MFSKGLGGIVVKVTSRFDPVRMEARYQYWRNFLAQEMAQNYRDAGYLGGLGELGVSKYTPGMLQTGKIPILANVFNIISKVPMVGKMFCGVFGGCKKPRIPWGKIYATVEPYARQYAKEEEEARIEEESHNIQVQRQVAVEKRSAEAAVFKLPEGVTSISRGALVLGVKGSPVEVRK